MPVCGLGEQLWTESLQLLLHPTCKSQVLGVRARLSGLKSQTFLPEEDDTITRGIKLFLFCFFWPSSNLGFDSFLKLCMWPFACLSSEATIWKLYCSIFSGTSWTEFWKPSSKATFQEKPFSQVAVCKHKASWFSCLEKLAGPVNVADDLVIYTKSCPRENDLNYCCYVHLKLCEDQVEWLFKEEQRALCISQVTRYIQFFMDFFQIHICPTFSIYNKSLQNRKLFCLIWHA